MQHATRWCRKNHQTLKGRCLLIGLTNSMRGAADVFWDVGDDSRRRWVVQTEFLKSPNGLEYFGRLGQLFNNYIASL